MNMELALQTFFEESNELLQDMEAILLEVDYSTITGEQLNALFRTMHTIKGSAGLFGLDAIVLFAHQVENALDLLRAGALSLDDTLAGLLLRCHDHVKSLLEATRQETAAPIAAGTPLLAELAALLPAEPETPEASVQPQQPTGHQVQRWLVSLRFGPDMLRNGMDPASFINYLHTMGQVERIQALTVNLPSAEHFDPETHYLRYELLFHSDCSQQQLCDAFEFVQDDSQILICLASEAERHFATLCATLCTAEAEALHQVWRDFGLFPAAKPASVAEVIPSISQSPRAGRTADNLFIKVEAHKIDSLINLIGELVIAGAATNLLARRAADPQLREATEVMAELVEQVRAGTLSMRMVQIGEVFQRFVRATHDVSRELHKSIQLHISGAETELDKAMVDKVGDPLMHLLRNAIDHGIETADTRRQAGKSSDGHVWLNAYHESSSVVIEVADDGAGLNADKILRKALERGLVSPAETLSESEVFKLIFEPGFSTAEQITDISGRGVGMDVVKKNIEQLHGSIEIDSILDQGTTFRIRLPLTLAIIDGLLVQVGQSTFVLPLEAVIECHELPASQTPSAKRDYFDLRGEILPLLDLAAFLEQPASHHARRNLVVVRAGIDKAALVVDALLGEFQTVIKPLGQLFRHLKAVSGSTILGSGEVALILDIPSLIHSACLQEAAELYSGNQPQYRGATSAQMTEPGGKNNEE
jgi:two-component system chemotaxis sensor kinase CheA